MVGLLIGASTMFKIGPAVFNSFISQHRVAAPGSTQLHLRVGKYVLYERTGTRRGGSGFTFTNNGPLTIGPGQVQVTGPNGEPVPVGTLGNVSETITRGSRIYTGAVSFRSRAAGDYIVKVESEPRDVIVARSIGDTFAAIAGWFVVAILGGLVVAIGVVLLIIGIVRRGRASNAAGMSAGAPWPPPDWPSAQKPSP